MQLLTGFLSYVLPFLILLTVLVFVHEMGHYLAARWARVRVEVFSIGFGPELFGRNDRHGTRWKFSAIPLGGYVKMFGDADAASSRAREYVTVENADGEPMERPMTEEERAVAFPCKSLWQRTVIVAAGPIANFLFAIVVLAALFSTVGQDISPSRFDSVDPDTPAARAGLMAGDEVLSVNGTPVDRFEELRQLIVSRPGMETELVIKRGEETFTTTVIPDSVVITSRLGTTTEGRLGVRRARGELHQHDPLTAVAASVEETGRIVLLTLDAVKQIILGQRSAEELRGPVGIAHLAGEFAMAGAIPLIWLAAMLSVNLGLINLFPVPMLDGGHLVFYAAEAIKGGPVGQRFQEYASYLGLAMILALMVFVTWNDVTSSWAKDLITSLTS